MAVTWSSPALWSNIQTWFVTGSTKYFLINPTREISPISLDPYYQLVGYNQGKTVVKRDGVWLTVQNKRQDWLDQCTHVFRGGYENEVTESVKTELEAAGYTVETRTS